MRVHTYIHIYIYIYISVCVCMYICPYPWFIYIYLKLTNLETKQERPNVRPHINCRARALAALPLEPFTKPPHPKLLAGNRKAVPDTTDPCVRQEDHN